VVVNRLAAVVVSVFLVGFMGVAHAEQKIMVVNYQKAIEQSPQSKATEKVLKDEYAKKTEDLNKAGKKLKTLEDKLNKDKDVMSAAELKRLEQDIRSRRRKLNFDLQEARDDFNLRVAEERRKLVRQIIEVVREIGKEDKVDMILSEGVVYASESVDITDKVIERLNKRSKD
jgi:outer membrane protein